MNRTIKFRGKSLQTGEWFYGYLQQYQERHAKILCICAISISTWKDALLYEIYPETVGQFTGLLDRNGKEIWEGDIFKEDNSGIVRSVFRVPGGLAFEDNPVSFGYDHRVPLYPYSSIAEMQNVSWLSQCCEVIGNIHDNPELLNTK